MKPHFEKPLDLSFRSQASRKSRGSGKRLLAVGAVALALFLGIREFGEPPAPDTRTAVTTAPLKLPATEDLPDAVHGSPAMPDGSAALLPVEPIVPGAAAVAAVASDAANEPPPPPGQWLETQVVSGDNMSLIFGRLGLSKQDLHRVLESSPHAKALKRLYPGQTLRVRAEASKVLELTHSIDYMHSLHVLRTENGFDTRIIESKPDIETRAVTAEIDSSLFVAGQRAGLSDPVIMELANIFGWDIDFVLDIRQGDAFSVVYNEYWQDGKKIKDGEIIAAEFVNQGRQLRAIRYSIEGRADYFSDAGRSMRKAFLRTPVNFSRISSRFNLRRKHPILNRIRAHRGVDYAAPHGTPIHATGDGKIVFAGTKGGYGRTIVVQHGSAYSTLYAHMARFARGVRHGERISQGQTIGYVGASGLATGPHLHYEFRVNGVHRDPLKVKFPSADPIPEQHLASFQAAAAPLIAQLDTLAESRTGEGIMVAGVETDPQRDSLLLQPVRPDTSPRSPSINN